MNPPIYLYILLQIAAITQKDCFNDTTGCFLRIEIWYPFSGAWLAVLQVDFALLEYHTRRKEFS